MKKLRKSLNGEECEAKEYAPLVAIVAVIAEKPRLMFDAY